MTKTERLRALEQTIGVELAHEQALAEDAARTRRQLGLSAEPKRTCTRQHGLSMVEGRLRRARAGYFTSGPAPYGYRHDRERGLVLVPEEAVTVRLAFSIYLKEYSSVKRVVQELDRLGRRPRRAKAWSRAGIAWLLSNATYRGTVHYGSVNTKGHHEPIVSAIVFNKVQLKLASQRKMNRPEPAMEEAS